MLPDELLTKLLELVNTGTYLAQVAGLVLVVTQFVKGIYSFFTKTVLDGDAARWLTVIVQVVFWVIFSLLQARGMDGQFLDWVKAIEGVLTNLLPVLFPALVVGFSVDRAYNRLHDLNVPGFHKAEQQAYKQAA